jgi:NADH-quinone oxidoreductase subunit F
MAHITARMVDGKAALEDIDLLNTVARQMQNKCLCPLGEFSIMAVLSSVQHFRADFEQQIAVGGR